MAVYSTPSDAYAASVALFEQSADAVLFTAPDGRIFDANEAACRMLLMSRDEICRRGRAGLVDRTDPRWERAVRERARLGRFAARLPLVRGDGSRLEADLSSAIFANADGEPRGIVVIRDVASDVDADEGMPNYALLDETGVSNRPAFIHAAEQQRRHAMRSNLGLGLLFIRLAEVGDSGKPVAPSDESLRAFAPLLSADARWGDIVGRVGERDFAMVVPGGDAEETLSAIRPISRRVELHNRHAARPLQIHVGIHEIATNDPNGLLALLDRAALSMSEHVSLVERDIRPCASRCCFTLDDPRTQISVTTAAEARLSERELSVLRLLATRRSYREIADALFVSMNTVKTHVSHVYGKLGVNGRKAAVARGRETGLLSGDPQVDPSAVADAAVDFGRISLIARALTAAIDMDEILRIIVMQGLAGLHADGAVVVLTNDDLLEPVATYGYSAADVEKFFPLGCDDELPIAVAARHQTIVWISNREEAYRRFPSFASRGATSSAWIAAPLVSEGQTFGAVGLSFLSEHAFAPHEREYIATLADLCAIALRGRHSAAPADAVKFAAKTPRTSR